MTAVAWCDRCRKPAPVDPEELVGDGGGDPGLLPVLVPPEGWIGDPDGDGLICGDCATLDEEMEFRGDLIVAEHAIEDDDA